VPSIFLAVAAPAAATAATLLLLLLLSTCLLTPSPLSAHPPQPLHPSSNSKPLLHTLSTRPRMPETRENQALMLSAVAGDYVPFFHTLTGAQHEWSWLAG
jgi:hypothetical protein